MEVYRNCSDKNFILFSDNRSNAEKIEESLKLFLNLDDEIQKQFEEAYEYVTHPQAIYTSRLLNSYTADLRGFISNHQIILIVRNVFNYYFVLYVDLNFYYGDSFILFVKSEI